MPTAATNLSNFAAVANQAPAGAPRKSANSPSPVQERFDLALNQARDVSLKVNQADSPPEPATGGKAGKTAPKTGASKGQGKGKSAGKSPRGTQPPVAAAATQAPKVNLVLADQADEHNPQDADEAAASAAQAEGLVVSSAAELTVVAAGKPAETAKTRAPSGTTAATAKAASTTPASKSATAKTAPAEDQEDAQNAATQEDAALSPVAQPVASEAGSEKPERRSKSASAPSAEEAAHADAANPATGKDTAPANSAAAATTAQASDVTATPGAAPSVGDLKAVHAIDDAGAAMVEANAASLPAATNVPTAAAIPVAATTAQARFAQENHPLIITGVTGQLLPRGGTMQIQLTPPDMGTLNIQVDMRDGVMNATFQTSNDDATHLLSHTLGQLKGALEAQGVSVDKLQVQQMPRSSHSGEQEESSRQQQGGADGDAAQEQQRRQLLQRMWRRLQGDQELDMVA